MSNNQGRSRFIAAWDDTRTKCQVCTSSGPSNTVPVNAPTNINGTTQVYTAATDPTPHTATLVTVVQSVPTDNRHN